MGIPRTEAELPAYVANFAAKLVASPVVYGTTAPVATSFMTIATAYQSSQTALVTARETGVRSEPLREARDAARAAMMPTLRAFYGMIQKNNLIPNAAKTEIGVKVPKAKPSRVNPPTIRPVVVFTSVVDRTFEVGISDPTVGAKRSRPAGATQTLVYFFAGENYDSDPNTWQFAGVATARKFDFVVPTSVPAGTRVWVCAAYTNARGDSGPVSVPISAAVQGSGATGTATAGMKIAA